MTFMLVWKTILFSLKFVLNFWYPTQHYNVHILVHDQKAFFHFGRNLKLDEKAIFLFGRYRNPKNLSVLAKTETEKVQ